MINLTEYKRKLEEYFYKEDVLEYAFNTFSFEYEDRLNNIEEELKRQQYLYEEKLNLTKEEIEKNEKYKGHYEEVLEINKRMTTREGLTELLNNALKEIEEFKEYTYKILYEPIYKKYVEYIVYGKEIDKATINNMQDYFLEYNGTLLRYTQKLCFYDNSQINNEWLKSVFNSFIHTGMLTFILEDKKAEKIFKNILKEKKINIDYEEIKTFIKYYVETEKRAEKLENETPIEWPKDEETEQKRAYLEYEDTSTYSFNELSKALIDNKQQGRYDLIEKNLNNINVILYGTEESKETINNLTPLELRVLNIIVSLYRENIQTFTDKQIAHIFYGKDTKITEDKINGINEAIDKIRKTYIEVKGNTKKKDIFFNSKNPFINLTQLGVRKADEKTQYYKIEGAPFFYTYTIRTGGKFITYDVKALTSKIEGVQQTERTQSLRVYLQEKISNITNGLDTPFIDLKVIYDLELGGRKTTTKKEKYNLVYYVEQMLKDLQKQYSFKYELKTKGRTKLGYTIKL